MKRILLLLGSCLFLVGCDTTIDSKSSKTITFTLDEDTQVEEEKPLDFFLKNQKNHLI